MSEPRMRKVDSVRTSLDSKIVVAAADLAVQTEALSHQLKVLCCGLENEFRNRLPHLNLLDHAEVATARRRLSLLLDDYVACADTLGDLSEEMSELRGEFKQLVQRVVGRDGTDEESAS